MCNDTGMPYKSKFKAVKCSSVSTKYAVVNSLAFLLQGKNPLSGREKKNPHRKKRRRYRRYTSSGQTDKFAC